MPVSQVKKWTIAFELIFGGFFPCRGRIDGREGDGRGLFWSMYLAEATERMLYEGGCGGGRDGSLGGLWRDESIMLNCYESAKRLVVWQTCISNALRRSKGMASRPRRGMYP